MNLIILYSDEISGDGRAVLSDDRAAHIRTVLKAAPGKVLRIGLLNGPLGEGTVVAVDERQVVLACTWADAHPPKPKVDLLLAMPRPKVMKRLWAQLAALGVGRIILVNAAKVERYYFDSHVIDPDFYNRFLIEGLQQARCTHLPEVLIRRRFRPFVEDELDGLMPRSLRLLAEPSASQTLPELSSLVSNAERLLLAVGPEGGWDAFELAKLHERNFISFRIGDRILRTDTACVGLLSALQQMV